MKVKLNNLIEGIVYIVIGILLFFIPKDFFKISLGIILIIINLPDAISSDEKKRLTLPVLRAYFLIFLGFAILIWGIDVLASIWGILILTALIIDFFVSKDKVAHFKQNTIKYLFALILISLGLSFLIDILLYLTGSILIIYGLILLTFSIFNFTVEKEDAPQGDVIEGKFTIDSDEK